MTVNDAIMKTLSEALPVGQLVAARAGLLVIALLAVAALRRGTINVASPDWRFQVSRGLVHAVATVVFMLALKHLNFGDAIVLALTGPIFLVVIGRIVFGEAISPGRAGAVAAAFLGVLLVVQPSLSGIEIVFLLPLAAALLEATREAVTRHIPPADNNLTTLFHTAWMTISVALAMSLEDWHAMTLETLLLLALCAALLGAAQYLMVAAFRRGRSADVAPFRYSTVFWAMTASVVFWHEVPTPLALAGALILATSGIYLVRETRPEATPTEPTRR